MNDLKNIISLDLTTPDLKILVFVNVFNTKCIVLFLSAFKLFKLF